jgi:hypothetical protein
LVHYTEVTHGPKLTLSRLNGSQMTPCQNSGPTLALTPPLQKPWAPQCNPPSKPHVKSPYQIFFQFFPNTKYLVESEPEKIATCRVSKISLHKKNWKKFGGNFFLFGGGGNLGSFGPKFFSGGDRLKSFPDSNTTTQVPPTYQATDF